jgi:hypothetical protein
MGVAVDTALMPMLVPALVTAAAAQLLDLATFVQMMDLVGPEAEANPLVALLFSTYGLPMVAVAKVALIGLITAIVLVLSRWPNRVTGVVLGTAIAAGLIGGVSNAIVLGVI